MANIFSEVIIGEIFKLIKDSPFFRISITLYIVLDPQLQEKSIFKINFIEIQILFKLIKNIWKSNIKCIYYIVFLNIT